MTPPSPAELPLRLSVDASLVLHLLLPYERDSGVERVWSAWAQRSLQVVGPALLFAEVTSVVRLRVATERLTPDEGEEVFAAFNNLNIRRLDRDDLHLRAWELAKQYRRPRAYDMFYLALADLENLELWTSDERFVNALANREPRVHWASAIDYNQPS